MFDLALTQHFFVSIIKRLKHTISKDAYRFIGSDHFQFKDDRKTMIEKKVLLKENDTSFCEFLFV